MGILLFTIAQVFRYGVKELQKLFDFDDAF
jgi:hypothetical protein